MFNKLFSNNNKKISKSNKNFKFFAIIAVLLLVSSAVLTQTSTATVLGEMLFGKAEARLPINSKGNVKIGEINLFFSDDEPTSNLNFTSSLLTPRQGHTANRLDNGKVILIGGDAGGTVEIFDPADGNTVFGSGVLNSARTGHTATQLADGRILIAGGKSNGSLLATTEIYDPSTGIFTATTAMNSARRGHTATVLSDGRILITGGSEAGTAEIYDASTNTFTPTDAGMVNARSNHSAVLMNDGRVFIVGGEENDTAEVFDPADGTFSATGNNLAHHRERPTLRVLPDGKIQIIGGNNDDSMEVYDPVIDTIGAHAHLIPTNDEHDALLLNHILGAPTRAALFHNGQADELLDRKGFTITELGNQAIVAGGVNSNGQTLSSFAVLNSSNATVTTDELDYAPGETAVISGTGWQVGEVVDIIIHEDPHTHTERRMSATADANGNFTVNYSVEPHDLGVTFIIGAKGQSSNRTAQTTFTDARTWTYTISPTNTSVSTLTNFNLTITNTGGNCGVNNDSMGSFRATIPTEFTLGTPTITTPPGKNWTVSKSGQVISAAAASGAGGDKICPNESIIITIPATATTVVGSPFTWTGTAHNALSWTTASQFNSPTGGQPTVSVVACTPSSIAADPTNQTTTYGGGNVQFSASANGDPAPTVQWEVSTNNGGSWSPVGGATNSTLTVMNPTVSMSDYQYRAVFLNNCGGAQTATTNPATLTVNQKSLTPNITADNKVYDGTTDATIATRTLSGGIVGTDDVTLTGGTATFDNKNVGTGKTVNITGLSLTGTDAGNYMLSSTSATVSADISAKHITGNFSAGNKVYDGNTSASVLTRTLNDTVVGDDVSLSGGTAAFDTKSVGDGKTVTLTGAVLAGTDAGNYFLDSVGTTTANITSLGITCSVTADNKIYDGNASAAIYRSLSGQIDGDDVECSGGSGSFADKNVGDGKIVTATGLGLTGNDAGNYTVNDTATTNANITPRTLNVSAAGVDREYDATTNATVTLSDDRVFGDDLTASYSSASFNDKNVGTNKPVNVSGISISGGTDFGNYTLGNTSAMTTADIAQKSLTVTATGNDKQYDGTPDAVVTLSDNRIAGDLFTASYLAAVFDNKNVGVDKLVNVTGISISGTDADNYSLADTTASTTADITALGIICEVSVADKTYDSSLSAMITDRALSGQIGGDDVACSGGTAQFENKNAGTDKTVNTSGLTLTGADSTNYTVNSNDTTTADIFQKNITGNFTAENKVYDGGVSANVLTRTLNDTVMGDDVYLDGGTASFADKNAANGKTVTLTGAVLAGTDAGNYFLDSVGTTTANIIPKALTATVTANNKVFDGNTTATITSCSFTNAVMGDDIQCVITGYAANFDTPAVGANKPVTATGLSKTGADSNNYSFNGTGTGTASIGAWTLNGFYQPVGLPNTYKILMPPIGGIVWNSVKGGQTVPLKFNIFAGAMEQTDVSAVVGFSVQDVGCINVGTTVDEVDFVTTGATQLRYDGIPGSGGQFIQNWQTPKTANKCYRTVMTAADGSVLVSFFMTKK